MNLAELAKCLPDATLIGKAETGFDGVSTDTRTIRPGSLFFALRGDRFDAHDFIADAVNQGAAALVVERPVDAALPQLVVPDSRRALGSAAAAWRARFDVPLIAVTGSNGKTTVTQMIAGILAAEFGEEHRLATRGNLNNDIGLPLMLFELKADHRIAVLELGMNHPGEIAYLAGLARPTVALVTNAQREHQEFLASVDATAHENGAVISALPADGTAVFPADDACDGIWRELAGARRVMDFARSGAAAITGTFRTGAGCTEVSITTPAGAFQVNLALAGEHNVHNALAATAAALAAAIPPSAVREGLEAFRPVAGRGVHLRTRTGARLIDDTYNANPDSVRAAIDVLAGFPPPRILALGDMGEVGAQGPAFHREIGRYARERDIDALLGLGDLCYEAIRTFGENGGRHFGSMDELIDALASADRPDATLLVKGSRFMRMERAVKALAKPE
ncbi:UDP-N-acetylmuramoyl-tripeptide--D-alanyl-D-alanine ligase [Methylococcus geothermalis]|uniref:UDP-N-acetylmuramoyl-tripeptide--D-alanyl-D-alanine ligase n=1 Tax=Methylococcus geothermalis TaxID=2681310 RepID=A0A858Q9A1_9GAMM|nr:UDP-N-acetylmuramoyl-tripeptide--D-alanyl-D-alanine ligase [Methylococcus geothermalis]QJD30492.1 UDP-N-acetylmuramoyl-tripeptide--D-alanyl-D-alanine ligase [Methylococcus geothermalis]